ncbi:primosomal replication protein N [Thermithiobacillus plumbiphilus]|uniref:primosomal replication protein N n=1 Tax=Thermithiobacillus plumbiphilus TaxID=1729899 RepID=UPI003BF96C6C
MAQDGLNINEVRLGGIVIQVDAVRRTPAGLPVHGFVLDHQSELREAGMKRRASCRIRVVAIGLPVAEIALIDTGAGLLVSGFIARDRSERENRLILHARQIEAAASEIF